MDKGLKERISSFQSRFGVEATGVVNEATWDHVDEIEQGWVSTGHHNAALQKKLSTCQRNYEASTRLTSPTAFIQGLILGGIATGLCIWILAT